MSTAGTGPIAMSRIHQSRLLDSAVNRVARPQLFRDPYEATGGITPTDSIPLIDGSSTPTRSLINAGASEDHRHYAAPRGDEPPLERTLAQVGHANAVRDRRRWKGIGRRG